MRLRHLRRCAFVGALLAAAPWSSYARAEQVHVVAKGHTLGKIAKRYHVDVELLAEINGLSKQDKIRPGLELVIPEEGKEDEARRRAKELRAERKKAGGDKAQAEKKKLDDEKFKRKPAHPGRVTFRHYGGETKVTLVEGGRVRDAGVAGLRPILRHRGGAEHDISPELAKLIARVSDHFGGRPLIVVSGYRPDGGAGHSNHHHGKALDFRVSGVPNEVVRDFCLTLDNTGVGYYPNSTFVHLDTRSENFAWIDRSGPGETPIYETLARSTPPSGSKKTLNDESQVAKTKPGKQVTKDSAPDSSSAMGSKAPTGESDGDKGRRTTVGKKKPD